MKSIKENGLFGKYFKPSILETESKARTGIAMRANPNFSQKSAFLLIVSLIAALYLACSSPEEITIFMLGDSTMADKPIPEADPERGWGQVLQQFFKDGVTVRNHAVNGRSTKSFLDEGRWQVVLDALQPGDYVFIQFGHNDQKIKDPARYTNPYTGYRRNLTRYVRETREKGATPILFSSIVRRKFNEFGVLEDTHGAYPLVMRLVAQEHDVAFIDLQLESEILVTSLGPEKSKALYLWIEPGKYKNFPNGNQDNTHFNEHGATAMAELAIEEIRRQKLPLAKLIRTER